MNGVIIIGGGPAGASLGCYLSLAGIKNTIFESSNHPRPHVGESLITAAVRVFAEIGFLEALERESFVRKPGAAWHAPDGREFSFEIGELTLPGVDQNYTYHVDRSKLDMLLLKHAEGLGSRVYQGVHVKQVLFDGSRATGVRVNLNGREVDLEAKLVVDASGRNTVVGNQLKRRVKDPIFDQYAVHAWFEGVDRGLETTAEFTHVYFLKIERGWVWQIPITDHITSVGAVADRNVIREAQLDLEGYFERLVATHPHLAHAMRNARRINNFKVEGDYSYTLSKLVGDGFLCIGDAAGFSEPIFSSGVSDALYGAKYAAECIRQAFERGDFSAAMFQPYEERARGWAGIWQEFIRLTYARFPLFLEFLQPTEHRSEALRLLQGEVYECKEAPLLDAMREYLNSVEHSESHLTRNRLAKIPLD